MLKKSLWLMAGMVWGATGLIQAQGLIQIKDTQTWQTFDAGSFAANGTLQIMAGGHLTVTSRSALRDGRHLIVEQGGRFTMNARLDMDSKGKITMNGGEFRNTVDFKFPDSSGQQDVQIWLYGGLIVCERIQSIQDRGSVLHVGSGILRIGNASNGDQYDPENTTAWKIVPIPPYPKVSFTPLGNGWKEISAASPLAAFGAVPSNGTTDVIRDCILSWIPARVAAAHDVYFGTVYDPVNTASRIAPQGVLVSQGQKDATYDPTGLFTFGQTYFWRVDEVNDADPNSPWKGAVWSFTAEPYAYPVTTPIKATASGSSSLLTGPEKTIDGSGLDTLDRHSTSSSQMWFSKAKQTPVWIQYDFDKVYSLHQMWVWNFNQLGEPDNGFGAKDVMIEVSTDGTTWTALGGVTEFAQGPGDEAYVHNTTVAFGGVLARYVRLNIQSNWGDAKSSGLSEVRFFYVPLKGFGPTPASGATGVALDAVLNWRPGRKAAIHEVYLGIDPNVLSKIGTVTEHRFDLGSAGLEYDRTYYWRVDEVNEAAMPRSWAGELWSFSTPDFLVVDDFEAYNDQCNRIFYTWADGYGAAAPECGGAPVPGNGSGSTVGNPSAPYAEQTLIHGGKQSMPMSYDNAGATSYSEAIRTFPAAQDWTASGIKSLSLYFRGASGNSGQLYVKINNTKVLYKGRTADLEAAAWILWNIDLSGVGGDMGHVTRLGIGVEGAGAKGTVIFDDIRLYPRTPEYITPVDPGKGNLVALYAFEGNASDTSGHGLNGTLKDAVLVSSGRPDGGSAVQLNQSSYVDLGNPAALNFGVGDWAVTAWFKTAMTGTGDANKGTLYAKGGDGAGGHRYTLCISEVTQGIVSLTCDDDVTKVMANSTTVTNNDQWHFVVGQRQGTAIGIFIDGRLEGTSTVAATYNLSGTSQHSGSIGAITNHGNGSLYKLFNGLIDDVRVYNRALSTEEILWLSGQTMPIAKPF